MGIGMCLRDENGCFCLAKTCWISPILNVDEGEAYGLLTAINWILELQLENVIFELDSKRVVDSFGSRMRDFTNFGSIIFYCRHFLVSFLKNSKVEFSRRQANVVAHVLAKVAPSLASSHTFIEIPHCIHDLIINEMN